MCRNNFESYIAVIHETISRSYVHTHTNFFAHTCLYLLVFYIDIFLHASRAHIYEMQVWNSSFLFFLFSILFYFIFHSCMLSARCKSVFHFERNGVYNWRDRIIIADTRSRIYVFCSFCFVVFFCSYLSIICLKMQRARDIYARCRFGMISACAKANSIVVTFPKKIFLGEELTALLWVDAVDVMTRRKWGM